MARRQLLDLQRLAERYTEITAGRPYVSTTRGPADVVLFIVVVLASLAYGTA